MPRLDTGGLELVGRSAHVAHRRALKRERFGPDDRVLADVERAPAQGAIQGKPFRAGLKEGEAPISLGAVLRESFEQRPQFFLRPDGIADREQRVGLKTVRDHRTPSRAEKIVRPGRERERGDG